MEELTGQRFGCLTVTSPTEQRKNGYRVWRCRCDCGKEVCVDVRRLRRGTALDCGCGRGAAAPKTDLRGQRFGRLVVVGMAGKSGAHGRLWRCRCDCGNTVEECTAQLRAGYRKSCGCLSRPPVKDYVGKRFGQLTVTAYAGKEKGAQLWRCRCDCGRELTVRQSNLQTGHTVSCGCRRDIENGIHFVNGTSVERIRSGALPANNTSGVRGVYWSQRQGRWAAQITFRGKKYHLGSFGALEDAAKARKKAEERLYGEFLEWYDGEREKEKKP